MPPASLRSLTLPLCLGALMAACSPSAMPTVQCGRTTVLDGAACVMPSLECGFGTHRVGSDCVRDDDGGLPPSSPWWPNVRVPTPLVSYSTSPRLAVDSTGHVYIAMLTGQDRSGAALYRSSDNGRTFVPIGEQHAAVSGWMSYVALAIDNSDRVFWGWLEDTAATGQSTSTLTIAVSNGAAFQSIGTFCTGTEYCAHPWLSTRPDGTVALLYASEDPRYVGSQFTAYTAKWGLSENGNPFVAQADITLSVSAVTFSSPMAFNAAGTPFVTATQGGIPIGGDAPATEPVSLLSFDGTQWNEQDVASVMVAPHIGFDPSAVVAGGSRVLVAYLDTEGEISVPAVASPTRSARHIVQNDWLAGSAAHPWITVDDTGLFHIMWLDSSSGRWVPWTTTTVDDTAFSAPEPIGDTPFSEDGTIGQSIGDASCLVVKGGRRYAAWTDTREGVSQVYFATSPAQ